MKPVFVRKMRATAEEIERLSAWITRIADKNLLDTEVLGYPATSILCAEREQQPKLYVPVHPVYVLDSLAPAPAASPLDLAAALKAVIQTVHWEAQQAGHGEIWFQCADTSVIRLAEAHGFTVSQVPLLKMKVGG